MTDSAAEEETKIVKLPETVWSEYEGQHVVVQLNRPYLAVTAPGIPAKIETANGIEFLPIPMLSGILRVKKDQRGVYRVTMLINDPDENKKSKVRVDIDLELIDMVTVTPLEQRIISE